MKEEWREIPGWPGFKASSHGRIKGKRGRIMSPCLSKHGGYPAVCLSMPGKEGRHTHVVTVHILVCLAFHGERPDGYEVDHVNRDKENNRPENLRWIPWFENRYHPSLDKEIVEQIRVAEGSQRRIAAQYGISQCSVSRIKAGRWPNHTQ